MNSLTRAGLLLRINAYLDGTGDFDAVRNYVFQYYEGEESYAISQHVEKLFAVLATYFEYDEAFVDAERHERMARLRGVISSDCPDALLAERAIFALEFPRIRELGAKYEARQIGYSVYLEQLRKLSPVAFDVRRLAFWSRAHSSLSEIDTDKLV